MPWDLQYKRGKIALIADHEDYGASLIDARLREIEAHVRESLIRVSNGGKGVDIVEQMFWIYAQINSLFGAVSYTVGTGRAADDFDEKERLLEAQDARLNADLRQSLERNTS